MKRILLVLVLAMGIIGLSSISRQQVYAKENLPEMDEESLTYNYTGEDITVHELDDLYKNKGTVYYKMGENGTWSTELPKVKDIGNVELEYYVLGNDNYYDLSSQDLPESIIIKVEVRKDNWGRKIEENGYEYYVDERGITSTEVKAGSLIWLKETSYGTSAWYGLDNTNNTFEPGSRFWIRWLHPIDDKEEYDQYFARIDDFHRKNAELERCWVFLTGVTRPDGTTEYTDLGNEVPLYVQLGNEWDETDVTAVFIREEQDEKVSIEYPLIDPNDGQFGNNYFPERTGTYAKLLIKRFHPYLIYDLDWGEEKTVNEVEYQVSPSGIVSAEVKSDSVTWVKENSDSNAFWFALDNTGNTFEPGSRFWVSFIGEDGGELYQTALKHLDDKYKEFIKDKKVLFFLTAGVMTPDGKECTRINDKVHLYIPLYDEQHGGNASGICNMDDPAVQLMAGNKQFNKAAMQSMAGHIKLNNPEGGQTAFYDLTVQGFSSFFENPSPIAFYYMNIPDTGVQKDETKGKETVGTEKTEEKNSAGTNKIEEKNSAGDGKTKKKNSAANKSAGNVESTKARLASGMEVEWRGRKLTFKWGRVAKATGYDVYAAYCGNKTFNRVKTTKDNRITVSKINGKVLNRRKDIKLYVVAKKGKKKLGASSLVHVAGPKSKYTNVRQINLKNKSCIIKKGKSKKIRAKIILKDKKKKLFLSGHVPRLRYLSGNKKVAIVNQKGVISAKSPGKCNVYVFGQNGMTRKIKVTVN